jgi:hypothetical protein
MAETRNIMYFKNSTPSWSCRGVLRDQIYPILRKQFGDFDNNIIKFSQSAAMYCEYYNKHSQVNLNQIKKEYVVRVQYIEEMNNPHVIEKLLLDIMHSNQYKMVKRRSRDNFLLWLKGNKKKQIELDKNIFCYQHTDYLYFVNYTKILNNKPNKQLLIKMLDDYLPPKLSYNILR